MAVHRSSRSLCRPHSPFKHDVSHSRWTKIICWQAVNDRRLQFSNRIPHNSVTPFSRLRLRSAIERTAWQAADNSTRAYPADRSHANLPLPAEANGRLLPPDWVSSNQKCPVSRFGHPAPIGHERRLSYIMRIGEMAPNSRLFSLLIRTTLLSHMHTLSEFMVYESRHFETATQALTSRRR